MLSIAICEDIKTDMATVKQYISQYMKDESYILREYYNGNALLRDLKNLSFDIIFMDIVINEENGIDLSAEINRIQPQARIIYQSSYIEFFRTVYKTEHIYFLLKPIEYEDFFQAMEKAVRSLENVYIILQNREKIYCDDIIYIELINHDTIFYYKSGAFLSLRIKTKELLEKLPRSFVRCHKSFIVNIDCVRSYNGKKYFTVVNHQRIPIGQKYASDVNGKILTHWGKSIVC